MYFFYGADHKVGTSTIVHSVAEALARNIEKEVLVLSMSNKAEDTFFSPTNASIDSLYVEYLSNKDSIFIPIEEIEKLKVSHNGYSFIPGPRSFLTYRRYDMSAVSEFLNQLKSEQRYMLLIDAGSEADHPLFLGALQQATKIFAVVTDQWTSFQEFDRKLTQVFNPAFDIKATDISCIINKAEKSHGVGNIEESLRMKGSKITTTLPLSGLGTFSESDRSPLSMQDPAVEKGCMELARFLAQEENSPFFDKYRSEGRLFGKITSFIK